MALRPSSALRSLKQWARQFRFARHTYELSVRALYRVVRAANRTHLRILEGCPAFAPDIRGSFALRADLTLEAAQQTFPYLRELLRVTGREISPATELRDVTFDAEAATAASSLKVLFDRHGSDKATKHNYHLIYGLILARPDEIRAVLEVGLGTNNVDVPSHMGRDGKPGASLRAFRDYLPRAEIFGADVDKRILFKEERITTFHVDQTKLKTVEELGRRLPAELDLIIDDGLHAPHANIAILMLAMTKLKEGGWVVIEDIDPAASAIWQVVASIMPGSFECALVSASEGMAFTARRTGIR